MFVPFNPKKHRGMPLYELSGSESDGIISDAYVLSTTTFEQASKAPWHYAVNTDDIKAQSKQLSIVTKGRKSVEGTQPSATRAVIKPLLLGDKLYPENPGLLGKPLDGIITVSNTVDIGSKSKLPKLRVKTGNKGGPGSGNFGHAGRQGRIGGSAPGRGGRRIPTGLGTSTMKVGDLSTRVPKQVSQDVQKMAGSLGVDSVDYHVVPEGYVMTAPKGSALSYYRSLRRVTSSHEAMAADTAVIRKLSDRKIAGAIGKNDILIDKSPMAGREKLRAAGRVAGAVGAGAITGAIGEGGRKLLSELRSSIKKGELDAVFDFVKRKGGLKKSDPEYAAINELRSMIDHNAKLTLPKADRDAWDSRHRSQIFNLEESVKQRILDAARSAINDFSKKRGGEIARHAGAGALGGAVAGAGAARLTGRGGVRHKYVLKQLRVGGQATLGQGTWAALVSKQAAGGHAIHIYSVE